MAPRDRAREALLMGLRLAEGIDLAWFTARTGFAIADAVDAGILQACIGEGYLTATDDRLTATADGRRRLDALLPRLVL